MSFLSPKPPRKRPYVEPVTFAKGERVLDRVSNQVGVIDMVISSKRYMFRSGNEHGIRLASQLEKFGRE